MKGLRKCWFEFVLKRPQKSCHLQYLSFGSHFKALIDHHKFSGRFLWEKVSFAGGKRKKQQKTQNNKDFLHLQINLLFICELKFLFFFFKGSLYTYTHISFHILCLSFLWKWLEIWCRTAGLKLMPLVIISRSLPWIDVEGDSITWADLPQDQYFLGTGPCLFLLWFHYNTRVGT